MASERQPHRYLSEHIERREHPAIPRIVAELNGFETYAKFPCWAVGLRDELALLLAISPEAAEQTPRQH